MVTPELFMKLTRRRLSVIAVLALLLSTFLQGCATHLPADFVAAQREGRWWVIEYDLYAWQVGRLGRHNLAKRVNHLLAQNGGAPRAKNVVSVSPSSRMWFLKDEEGYEIYVWDILGGSCRRVPLPYHPLRSFYSYSWSPDEKRVAIASYDATGPSTGLGPEGLWIYDIKAGTVAEVESLTVLQGVGGQLLFSSRAWVDNRNMLVAPERNLIAKLSVDKNKLTPFTAGHAAIVLPRNRALIQTLSEGTVWDLVRLSKPKSRLRRLGAVSHIGVPTDAGLREGRFTPPMCRFPTVSPDGKWLLVGVTHVVGTFLGFAAPRHQVYLRRIDDDRCWKLGRAALGGQTTVAGEIWVSLSPDVVRKLGLPSK